MWKLAESFNQCGHTTADNTGLCSAPRTRQELSPPSSYHTMVIPFNYSDPTVLLKMFTLFGFAKRSGTAHLAFFSLLLFQPQDWCFTVQLVFTNVQRSSEQIGRIHLILSKSISYHEFCWAPSHWQTSASHALFQNGQINSNTFVFNLWSTWHWCQMVKKWFAIGDSYHWFGLWFQIGDDRRLRHGWHGSKIERSYPSFSHHQSHPFCDGACSWEALGFGSQRRRHYPGKLIGFPTERGPLTWFIAFEVIINKTKDISSLCWISFGIGKPLIWMKTYGKFFPWDMSHMYGNITVLLGTVDQLVGKLKVFHFGSRKTLLTERSLNT